LRLDVLPDESGFGNVIAVMDRGPGNIINFNGHMDTKKVKELPAARCLIYADGVKRGDVDKPFIAVANSFNEVTPGHIHLRKLGEKSKRESELLEESP
jgi:dihydroxyacid dehydratase/phosphogluconate dehydratase